MLIMATAVKWPVLAALFHPVAALCILLGANIHSVFSTAPFQALGRWSYSIYLLHVPVLNGFALLVGMQTMSGSVPLKGTMLALTIVLAAFAYHFIERPFFSPKSQAAQSAP
jgi:peptidoglycan/LPS O-acetylase OafA/YrhL